MSTGSLELFLSLPRTSCCCQHSKLKTQNMNLHTSCFYITQTYFHGLYQHYYSKLLLNMVTRIPIASNNMPNQHNYMLFGHICPCNTKVRMIHTHLSVTLQFSVPRLFVSRINLGKTRNSGRRCLTNQAKRSLESALGAAMLLLYQRN